MTVSLGRHLHTLVCQLSKCKWVRILAKSHRTLSVKVPTKRHFANLSTLGICHSYTDHKKLLETRRTRRRLLSAMLVSMATCYTMCLSQCVLCIKQLRRSLSMLSKQGLWALRGRTKISTRSSLAAQLHSGSPPWFQSSPGRCRCPS